MIGPHIIGSVSDHLETLRKWQPRAILVLDPSSDQVHQLRQICPHTFIVGRVFRDDSEVDHQIHANPQEAARWAHNAIMQRFTPDIDAWQVENEVLQAGDNLRFLNDFALERMRLADANGYKAAILAFSVGNPDLPENDRMAAWRQVFPAITYADEHNHVIAVHQYGSPSLSKPDENWYLHRLERQVLPLLPFSRVKFVCTEFGIDNLINGFSHGQRSGWKDTSTAGDYAQDLIAKGSYLERFKDRVIGYCVFTLGGMGGWDKYDIRGEVADRLAAHYQANPQPRLEAGLPGDGGQPAIIGQPGGAGQPGGLGQPGVIVQPPGAIAVPAFRLPDVAVVANTCRVRLAPGLNAEVLGLLEQGFSASILGGPQHVDGLIWWKVHGVKTSGDRVIGWAAQQDPSGIKLLEKPDPARMNRIRAPFDGSFAVSQFFGEDPATYLRFGLRGHNAIDLGLPIGVPIKAVDSGVALAVSVDPTGYGQFIRLQHTWGESLYAHLSGMNIFPGQQVLQGQVIGASGNTGFTTGAHLHFAIRFNPFDVNDGWLGYRDPLAWLPANCYRLPFAPDAPPVGGPGVDPPVVVHPPAAQVQRHLAASFGAMHLQIQPLTPPIGAQVTYVVKDVFTTQDGKWDVGDRPAPYGIEQWARDAFLKPAGAPDVFDDAGGATHLFGAVIGLDGQLIRNHTMRYWTRDNQNRVEAKTKQGSGWANFSGMNKDSGFVPDNGETGPWCWAPEGASESVCGGGLPNRWHVSTFVVWQAVPQG